MLVGKQIFGVRHESERKAECLRRHHDLHRAVRREKRLDQRFELAPAHHALAHLREERHLVELDVLEQQRHRRCDVGRERRREPARAGDDDDVTVSAGHDVVRVPEDVARVVAAADRALECIHCGVVLVRRSDRLDHRHIDVIAAAALGAILERGKDADPELHAGDVRAGLAAGRQGLAIRVAGVVHQRAHRHRGEAVAIVLGIRAGCAERRYLGDDELREVRLQVVVRQPPCR